MMKNLSVMVLLSVIFLASCQRAPSVVQSAPKVIKQASPYIDDALNLIGQADEAARAASGFSDEAWRALQNNQFDDWSRYTQQADEAAVEAQSLLKKASLLAAKVPEEQLTDDLLQSFRAANTHSSVFNLRAFTTESMIIDDMMRNPGSTLAQDRRFPEIVRAYACLHLTTILFEGSTPTPDDYVEFAADQGIGLVDGLLELDGYASKFIDLAKGFQEGEPFAQQIYKGKVNEYCQELLQ